MNLERLIEKSGDSVIEQVVISWKEVSFKIELYDDEEEYLVKIKVSSIHFEGSLMNHQNMGDFCRLETFFLIDTLESENNRYMPMFSFKKIMENRRNGVFLGHGLKRGDDAFVLSIHGERCVLHCLILNERDVEIAINGGNAPNGAVEK